MKDGHSVAANGSLSPRKSKLNDKSQDVGNSTESSSSEGDVVSQADLPGSIASAMLPEWLGLLAMVALIFGGCCSNVFALEAIIKEAPGSGTLITCFQFILTALFTLPSHLDFSRGIRHLYLKPRAIPFQTWLIYTALFVTINLLNNKAFHYKISVPLHIILRSAGPVATMTVHWFTGKRFELRKVLAVLLLFVGVVLAAIADSQAKSGGVSLSSAPTRSIADFWTGFGILCLALMLSAGLGVFTDRTYATYGRGHTEENLFYSHSLSLPFILFRWSELTSQTHNLIASPSSSIFISYGNQRAMPSFIATVLDRIPIQVGFLVVNGLTQYFCIRGVNQLAARSSSLTVGIVLNIRKLVSLLLSIWLFGNRLAPGVLVGAALVFLGGGLYAVPSASRPIDGKEGDGKKKEL